MPSSTRSRDMNRLKRVYPSVNFAAKMLRDVEQPTAAVNFVIDSASINTSRLIAGSYSHTFIASFVSTPIVVIGIGSNDGSPLLAVSLSDLTLTGVTVNASGMANDIYIIVRAFEPVRGSRIYDFNKVRTVYPKKQVHSTLGSSDFYAMTITAANAIQAGVATIVSSETKTITFQHEMPSIPTISYAMLDSTVHTPSYVENITTTGFTIRFSTVVTCQLHWEALLETYA